MVKRVKLIWTLVFVCAAAALALLCTNKRSGLSAPEKIDNKLFEGERRRAKRMAELEIPVVRLSLSASNEIVAAYCLINEAYTNEDICALRESFLRVPGIVTNVNDSVLSSLRKQIPFTQGFLVDHKRRDFESTATYGHFVELNTELAKFLGGIEVGRGGSQDI